jgi:hypothetical protein
MYTNPGVTILDELTGQNYESSSNKVIAHDCPPRSATLNWNMFAAMMRIMPLTISDYG